jgi:hypothetical protein
LQGPSGCEADDQEYTSQINVQSPRCLESMRTPDVKKRSVQKQKHLSQGLPGDPGELLVAANNELEAAKEEISRKNNELESVKKQLQESEARNIQAEQQSGIVVELMQPRGVQTRSMQKRKRPLQGPSGCEADDQEYTSQINVQSPRCLESMRTPDVWNILFRIWILNS